MDDTTTSSVGTTGTATGILPDHLGTDTDLPTIVKFCNDLRDYVGNLHPDTGMSDEHLSALSRLSGFLHGKG